MASAWRKGMDSVESHKGKSISLIRTDFDLTIMLLDAEQANLDGSSPQPSSLFRDLLLATPAAPIDAAVLLSLHRKCFGGFSCVC